MATVQSFGQLYILEHLTFKEPGPTVHVRPFEEGLNFYNCCTEHPMHGEYIPTDGITLISPLYSPFPGTRRPNLESIPLD